MSDVITREVVAASICQELIDNVFSQANWQQLQVKLPNFVAGQLINQIIPIIHLVEPLYDYIDEYEEDKAARQDIEPPPVVPDNWIRNLIRVKGTLQESNLDSSSVHDEQENASPKKDTAKRVFRKTKVGEDGSFKRLRTNNSNRRDKERVHYGDYSLSRNSRGTNRSRLSKSSHGGSKMLSFVGTRSEVPIIDVATIIRPSNKFTPQELQQMTKWE